MSTLLETDCATFLKRDASHSGSPVKTKPTPPPVLPKSPRKTNRYKDNDPNTVSISVTAENKELSLEEKYKQMEMDLKAVKLERDSFQQDVTRLKGELQDFQKETKKTNSKLDHYNMLSKSKKVQGSLKCWNQSQPCVSDLCTPMPHDELADPQELIKQFTESERLYLNCLEALNYHFLQPMMMFSIFKCDILSTQQFQALFLNSPQLLIVHRLFYQHLAQLKYLPKASKLEEFVINLERFTPSFSLYAGFQSEHYMVNLQRELSQCQSKPQFSLLLENLNQKCEGRTLVDLLRIIAGRLSEYQTLLSGFLEDRLKDTRGMKEGIVKRLEAVKRFLDTIQLDLMQDKDWWDCIVEKLKVLNRVSTCSPIPMDIFHPATCLVKQGSVNIVVKGRELQRHLFLFTSHLAVGEKSSDQRIHFLEGAMKSLGGAVVYSTIDTAGQAIEPDFHSGLKEDMLGFRINLSQDSLVVRVGKPNEKKSWVESIDKVLQMIQSTKESEVCEVVIPDESLKIAAASLEKLFQQLTNPQIPFKEEFIEVFLNTYRCFTTPKDVLTALLNCIHSPDKGKASQPLQPSANGVFTFNMEDGVDTESSMSASNSIQNISDYDSDDSLTDSPVLSRHAMSTPSRRMSKSKSKAHGVRQQETRTSGITTDSDSSPYTSGVPIADKVNREVEMGWDEAEMSLIVHPSGDRSQKATIPVENSLYPSSHSRSSNYSQESYSARDSDDEEIMDSSNCRLSSKTRSRSMNSIFLDTDSLFQSVHESLQGTHKDLLESQESKDYVMVDYPSSAENGSTSSQDRIRKQSKMTEDIDEANRLCEEMLSGLQAGGIKHLEEDDDSISAEMDEINFRKYSRTRRNTETPSPNIISNRLSVTSNNLSFSEPDLVVLSLKQNTVEPFKGQEENDELLTSLPATIVRKFMEPSTPQHSKVKQKGGKFRFKNKKPKPQSEERERKSEPANLPDRRHTLNPSSSLYFTSSTEIKDVRLSPSRGITSIFKKKDKEAKKLKKAPSMQIDCTDGADMQSRRRNVRSSSLAPSLERHVYINIDEFGDHRQNGRNRNEDSSSNLKRSTSTFKNFTLASKVFLILGRWIETHFEDFHEDPEIMEMLDDFLQNMLAIESAESKLAEQLFTLVNHFKHKRRPQHANLEAMESSYSKLHQTDSTFAEDSGKPSKVLGNRSIDLGRLANLKEPGFVKAFGEQLTLLEYSCYHQITRRELLNCNWKKKDKEALSPNVCRLIKQTNEMTSWICTEVLTQDSPTTRAIVLEHFIGMATICYKHFDMHCALSIVFALNSAPIKRLTKTWDAVDKKTKHKYEKLKDICDPQEKCKKLREKIERVTADEVEKYNRIPSCLPYLGAYLDLIYCLDIGVKTYNADGLVNFAKMTKLSSIIDTFLQYQRTPYTFEPKQDIVAYIICAKKLSDNELYDLSVAKEPSKR